MRSVLFFVLFAVMVITAFSAQAGTLTYANGETKWTPTLCNPPAAPVKQDHDPEAAADDLNARLMQHKAYVQEVESFMRCVSEESQRDAESSSRGIMSSANQIINAAQVEADVRTESLARSRAKITGKE